MLQPPRPALGCRCPGQGGRLLRRGLLDVLAAERVVSNRLMYPKQYLGDSDYPSQGNGQGKRQGTGRGTGQRHSNIGGALILRDGIDSGMFDRGDDGNIEAS